MMKRLLVSALALGLIASGAMAVSLTPIAPIGSDTSTVAKAVTPNGIVVGKSTSTGFIWDATNGTRAVLSSDNAQADDLFGAGYRTVNGSPQLVLFGMSAGPYPTNWFSNDDGMTWGPKVRDTGKSAAYPASNGMAVTPGSDVFYNALRVGDFTMYVAKGQGNPAAVTYDVKSTGSYKSSIQGVSGTGVGVGRRKDGFGIYQNTTFTATGTGGATQAFFEGLIPGSLYGEAWSISSDSSAIFGLSPVADGRPDNWPYKYTVGVGIAELPTLPGTEGSVTRGLPYGASQSGEWAVGMDYVGTERAALWHCPGSDPANWTVTDLTTYFADKGMLGNFSRLHRAFSVAEDGNGGIWVAGIGVWSDATTRGWVAYIPEPATLTLLLLGGLPLLRRRH